MMQGTLLHAALHCTALHRTFFNILEVGSYDSKQTGQGDKAGGSPKIEVRMRALAYATVT